MNDSIPPIEIPSRVQPIERSTVWRVRVLLVMRRLVLRGWVKAATVARVVEWVTPSKP